MAAVAAVAVVAAVVALATEVYIKQCNAEQRGYQEQGTGHGQGVAASIAGIAARNEQGVYVAASSGQGVYVAA